jgi:hypothetical protein
MRRWPIEIRFGGDTSPPVTQAPAPPATQPPADRPTNYIGFFSDLSRNPKQAMTFMCFVGGTLFMITGCIVAMLLVVAFAAKGTKGAPLHYIWPIGVGGASILTLIVSLVTAWIRRRLARASQASVESGQKQDAKHLGVGTHAPCLRSPRQYRSLQPTASIAVIPAW